METIIKERIKLPSFEVFLKKVGKKIKKPRDESIRELKEIMSRFEQKYSMSTEEFIPRFKQGEFEMDDNYLDYELLDWLNTYELHTRFTNGE